MRNISILILAFCATTAISSCGSGNGTHHPTSATVTLSTSGTLPAGTSIGGIDATLVLPSGVTVAAVPDSQNPDVQLTDAGVVTATGAADGSYVAGAYSPATETGPGTVRVALINATGFGTGEFAVIKCDVAEGSVVAAADFTTGSSSFVDLDGAAISGLNVGLTVELK